VSRPWLWPFVVAALAVPIVAGFGVGGPALGLGLGAVAAGAIIVVAARAVDRGTIETARAVGMRRRVLVLVLAELDDPAAVEAIREKGEYERHGNQAEMLLLAPAMAGVLDRWAVDVGRSREEAQRRLVVTTAALSSSNVEVRATVGDPDPVLAVEDALREFAATEVILVARPTDADAERIERELGERLRQPLLRVSVGVR
jgi:hypothetical protein